MQFITRKSLLTPFLVSSEKYWNITLEGNRSCCKGCFIFLFIPGARGSRYLGIRCFPNNDSRLSRSICQRHRRKYRANTCFSLNFFQTPYSADGRRILDEEKVSDSDPSTVSMLHPNPSVSISNKVYLGDDDGASCGSSVAVDEVEETFGTQVTFCFTVENTGDTNLASVQIKDEALSFTDTSISSLSPGEKATVSLPGSILGTVSNEAIVTADPVSLDFIISVPSK